MKLPKMDLIPLQRIAVSSSVPFAIEAAATAAAATTAVVVVVSHPGSRLGISG